MNEENRTTNEKLPVLKQIRLALGMTQEEFAKIIGVKRLSIVRWENGQREPMMTFAQYAEFLALAETVGISKEEIPRELSKPHPPLVA